MDDRPPDAGDRLRRRIADQLIAVKRLRLKSKQQRAAASATVDKSLAMRLVARGQLLRPEPPIPTHPPEDWGPVDERP